MASKRGKENTLNGVGKTKTGFKNFSIRLHDLAYSPLLKHKIGTTRKRLMRQKKYNLRHRGEEQKRIKLMQNADEGESTQTKQTEVVTSEEADSTVQLNQVEQCWKLRRPFFEVFDQNQHEDSRESAKMLLQWLIYPVENDKFIKYHTTLLNAV